VEERQVDQVGVVAVQVDVARADPPGPDRVGVRVHDGLRLRGRPAGEEDPRGEHRLGIAHRRVCFVAVQLLEGVGRDEPLQRGAGLGDEVGEAGLGDGRDALRLVHEVAHLGRDRAGVGRDADRADPRAGVPGQHHLGAVLRVDEDLVALRDAARDEPRGEPRLVGLDGGPVPQQPGHVLALHLERGDIGGRGHGSSSGSGGADCNVF
jgi:hypothetical protein